MDCRKLEVLLRAVELGSFSAAAAHMGYTQSGVTHMMNALEQEIGFPVLHRSHAGVHLTAEGERLLPHIRELVRSDERLRQEAADILGVETGNIRIGTFSSISMHWLPEIIELFEGRYPDINLEILEGETREMRLWLEEGVTDLCFSSRKGKEDAQWIHLWNDPMLAVLPKGHRLAEKPVVALDELVEEPFLLYSTVAGQDSDIAGALAAAGKPLHVKYASNFDNAIINMVSHGLGVSLLPELAIRGQTDRVEARPISTGAFRELGIAMVKGREPSPAMQRFISCVLECIPESPHPSAATGAGEVPYPTDAAAPAKQGIIGSSQM